MMSDVAGMAIYGTGLPHQKVVRARGRSAANRMAAADKWLARNQGALTLDELAAGTPDVAAATEAWFARHRPIQLPELEPWLAAAMDDVERRPILSADQLQEARKRPRRHASCRR